MKGKLLWSIFLALVAVFLLLFIAIFVPMNVPRVLSFVVPFVLLLLLGVALIVLTVNKKVKGMLRVSLLLTGASAVAMVVSIIMHNVMGSWVSVEEPVTYIMAVFVCPIAFLVGGVGSVVLGFKKPPPRRRRRKR
jgi:hypothetical protein